MAQQQKKRRRKRYNPGSSYAGDVRPTGVLGVLGSNVTIRVVFIAMALALVAGGLTTVFASGVLGGRSGNDNPEGFVIQDEDDVDDEDDGGSQIESIEVRQYNEAPGTVIDASKAYTATIRTDLGDIEVELLDDEAPEAVNNFVFLAQDGFYDGLVFHYVQPGFSANAGDPACTGLGDACRGTGGPGYDLDAEGTADFSEGMLGLANASQFFITLSESDQFAGFPALGRVVSGLDVAERLSVGTRIESVEIQES